MFDISVLKEMKLSELQEIAKLATTIKVNGVKKEALIQGEEILKELEITHLKDRVIFDLSGGEQKIIALAGLLILKPKILLLDEPNALDEQSEKRIVEILNSIKKSMIIVSHHRSFIDSLVSKVYRLDCGSLGEMS